MSFDFVAIDFETANYKLSSACSMGLVAVKDNNIIETKYFLIHPPTLDFDNKNIEIHGITPDDVRNSPNFAEIWYEIKHYFEGNIIVAHNATFDISVLKNCLLEYHLEIPDFPYMCSMSISSRACYGEKGGQSLKDVATYFGIEIKNHHNALDDAITCAKIVIESINTMKNLLNKSPLLFFARELGNVSVNLFSELKPMQYFGKKPSKPKIFNKVAISEVATSNDVFNESHIFYGKNIVFTGELRSMDRKDAMQRVVDLGAVLKSGVSSKTDFLIVGAQDISVVGDDGMSSKEEKAWELKNKGHHIQILNEDEFIKHFR